ncbi:MAG: 30S ribosomal protein S12 methylthiotransferase RimO [Anaerolineales bacterium]
MPVQRTYHLITLGCAKNTVDSDSMAVLLSRGGLAPARSPARADVIVVNTCGFIDAARAESIETLRKLAAAKRPGQQLIAAGCLTQRSGTDLAREIPGLDAILGTRRWMDILSVIDQLRPGSAAPPVIHLPAANAVGTDERDVVRAAVRGASAYLKIADGCRRPCAFCAIPAIKGTLVSRPKDRILDEARILQDAGVRELVLLAQDTTAYASDLGVRDGLAGLLEGIAAAAPRIDWIRILYAYPGAVSDRLIDVIASLPQVVPYLDIPLQHAHPDVLRRMNRPADVDWVRRTVERMRARLPGLAVRTAFIAGFAGESDSEFEALLAFLREMRFDRVGCFLYSREEGTAGAALPDDVPPALKQERRNALMELQQGISLEQNRAWVGRRMDILVEGRQKGLTVGRSFRDAPEVDGVVLLEGDAPLGAMVRARITGALPYDLTGVVEEEKTAGGKLRPSKARSVST